MFKIFYLFAESATWQTGSQEELESDLRQTQKQAFLAGTVRNFLSQWRAFYAFCHLYCICVWPVTAHMLCLFAQFLSYNLRALQSIANYVAGVHTLPLLTRQQAPDLNVFEWKITYRGLRCRMRHTVKQASPLPL